MSGTRHNCLGPGITGRGPDIISRGPDIFISGPRPYSQWRSLGPDIKSRRPDIISQGPNLVSWGPNIINSGPRHKCFLFILKYYFSHSTQYNHLYDVPSQPPYNLVSTKWSFYHSPVYISYLSCVCMTCSMNLARNTKTEVTPMCLYRILVRKRHHPVQYWSIMEADTKTVVLLY